MLWDFSIRTDHEIEARRLELLAIDQKMEQLQHYRRGNYGQWKGASKRISLMGTSSTCLKYRSLPLTGQNTGHHAYERTLIY